MTYNLQFQSVPASALTFSGADAVADMWEEFELGPLYVAEWGVIASASIALCMDDKFDACQRVRKIPGLFTLVSVVDFVRGADDEITYWLESPVKGAPTEADRTIEETAKVFAEILRIELGPDRFSAMREANFDRADGSCASHNFIDSNEAMLVAFHWATGREPDPASETDAGFINLAWDIARRDYLTAKS